MTTDADRSQSASSEMDVVVRCPSNPVMLSYLVAKLKHAGISVKDELDTIRFKESFGSGPHGEPVADIAGLVLQFAQDNIHLILPRVLDITREVLTKISKSRSVSIICEKVTHPDGTIMSSCRYDGPVGGLTADADAVRSILDCDSE